MKRFVSPFKKREKKMTSCIAQLFFEKIDNSFIGQNICFKSAFLARGHEQCNNLSHLHSCWCVFLFKLMLCRIIKQDIVTTYFVVHWERVLDSELLIEFQPFLSS